jgi:hypothetical protein
MRAMSASNDIRLKPKILQYTVPVLADTNMSY